MASFSSLCKRTLFSISPPPNPFHFFSTTPQPPCTTVTTAVSVLKHHRSKSRWTHLRTLFPHGFNPNQFSQITVQIRNNPHLALTFFLFTIKHSLCNHSLLSYATIIHTLARSRQKSRALTLIQSAIRKFQDVSTKSPSNSPPLIFETLIRTYRSCDSAPFVFDLLIKACVQSKRIDQAIEIVRMLRSKGVCPLISTCNSLIMSVCKINGSVAGYDVYNELFECNSKIAVVPNVHTYKIIMLAFYRDGLIENLEQAWSDMIVKNCIPNAYSYSILMAAYCDNGRMDEAFRVWEEMRDNGLEHDVMAYNTMIGGFCEAGEVYRAEEFFKEMGLNGEESTRVTYEHLIIGYCKIDNLDSAMLLYKDMCSKGFVPVVHTVDALIKGLCKNRKASEALEVSRFATKQKNVVVSCRSYEFVIKGLCGEGRMEEALKVQAEMVGRGYEPNSEIYLAFIYAYEKEGNTELAGKLKTELTDMC